jgi:hypothetical protein
MKEGQLAVVASQEVAASQGGNPQDTTTLLVASTISTTISTTISPNQTPTCIQLRLIAVEVEAPKGKAMHEQNEFRWNHSSTFRNELI